MIHLNHMLEATNGVLIYPGRQHHFDAFSHDTRQLMPGEMFVAVRGEQGDGHDYLLDAVHRGAAGLLVEAQFLATLAPESRTTLERAGVATISVPDTRVALQHYASFILQRWHPTVIAVTGSSGKTSTKEAIASVLASNFATFKSWQNYNDLLGLPLSLGRLEEHHEYAVLELSCDHPGEISDLCRICRPQIGVLTNISPAQLQYFGTVERLAAELGTLLTSLPQDGLAIVNGDDAQIQSLTAQSVASITTFSPSAAQNVQVTWEGTTFAVGASAEQPHSGNGEGSGRVSIPSRPSPIYRPTSHLLGAHHVSTLLAAYTVGRYCGLQPEEIEQALANLRPLAGRLNPLSGKDGSMLLDDTHNANPASVIAGLETLKALPTHYRIAVLGDMLRLGDYEEEAHRLVGRKAATCVDFLVTRGERAALIAEAAKEAGLAAERVVITSTHEDAAQAVRQNVGDLASPPGHTRSGHPQGVPLLAGDLASPPGHPHCLRARGAGGVLSRVGIWGKRGADWFRRGGRGVERSGGPCGCPGNEAIHYQEKGTRQLEISHRAIG
jgi:Alr-MurF fusion protein